MNPYRKRALRGYDHDKKKSNRHERKYGKREAYKALMKLPERYPSTGSRKMSTVLRSFVRRPMRSLDNEWWKGL